MTTGRSRTTDTYDRLRADILAGRRRPGQRLPFAELCAFYGASVGAVREVLMRLSEQGLVRGEPQIGFAVASISVVDLVELTDARCLVESLLLERGVSQGDVDWEGRIVAAHHVLRRTTPPDSDDGERLSDRWAAAHATFHRVLLAGAGNHRLEAIASNLRDSAELYRRWSWTLETANDRDVGREHREILEAVLARDAISAGQRLRHHINRTTELLLDNISGDSDLRARLSVEA